MAGYTRQDTANNISNGSVIDADDFDAEYNAVEAAFNASTGHAHDGSAGEGAPIEKVGPLQDLIVSTTQVIPKTTNTLDLGSASVQFKNAWFDGTVDTDALAVSGSTTVGGTLDVTGTITGDLTGDVTGNVTGDLTGDVTGNITGNVTGDLTGNADTATTWEIARSLTLTGDVAGTVTGIDGSGNISVATTVQANSVALGTDTTGAYVGSLVAGTGITLINNSGEGSTPTIAIGQPVGTSDNVTFGNATIQNLTVSGTTTTVNSNDVNIADSTLTLNSDETGTPSQDAGIVIERGTEANKSFIWDESEDKWSTGGETIVAGSFEGPLTGAVTGNADTATALQTSRTIQLTGDVTGSAAFDGTSNVSISATTDVEILKADTDDNLTAGYTATAADDGTKSSGSYTPSPVGGNLRRITNGGAFTLAAPTATGDYTLIIQMTNGASAGSVSFSGFTSVPGFSVSTVEGKNFFLYITKINGFTSLRVEALN